MIYLISDNNYLKIGFSQNPESRLKSFKTSNPGVHLVQVKPGSLKDEKIIQKACENWHHEREWFYDTLEVRQIFQNYNPFPNELFEKFKVAIEQTTININTSNWFGSVNNKVFQEIKSKTNVLTEYPENFREYLQYLSELELLHKLRWCFSVNEFDKTVVKQYYCVGPNKILKFPYNYLDNLYDEAKTNTEKAKEYFKSLEELKKDYSKCEYDVTKTFLQDKINKTESLLLETERVAENNIKLFEKYNEVLKDNAI